MNERVLRIYGKILYCTETRICYILITCIIKQYINKKILRKKSCKKNISPNSTLFSNLLLQEILNQYTFKQN